MLLKIIASIILILLFLTFASKLLVRIIWFLFPYSGVSLKLRTIVVGKHIARHLTLGEESPLCYQNRFGRTCVVIPHSAHGGFSFEDIGYITEELFSLLAMQLAPHFGYTRGTVFIEDGVSVFQFWKVLDTDA